MNSEELLRQLFNAVRDGVAEGVADVINHNAEIADMIERTMKEAMQQAAQEWIKAYLGDKNE